MTRSQATGPPRRALTLGLLGVAALGTGCATRLLWPPNADGTYCYRIGRRSLVRRTCTTDPIPPRAAEDDAKRFEPAPGRLTVYIVRDRWGDVTEVVRIAIGAGAAVDLVPESFARWRLPAGTHRITATWAGGPAVLEVSGGAGEVVFVELIDTDWFWGSSFGLERGDAGRSRERAARLRLVGDQG